MDTAVSPIPASLKLAAMAFYDVVETREERKEVKEFFLQEIGIVGSRLHKAATHLP